MEPICVKYKISKREYLALVKQGARLPWRDRARITLLLLACIFGAGIPLCCLLIFIAGRLLSHYESSAAAQLGRNFLYGIACFGLIIMTVLLYYSLFPQRIHIKSAKAQYTTDAAFRYEWTLLLNENECKVFSRYSHFILPYQEIASCLVVPAGLILTSETTPFQVLIGRGACTPQVLQRLQEQLGSRFMGKGISKK